MDEKKKNDKEKDPWKFHGVPLVPVGCLNGAGLGFLYTGQGELAVLMFIGFVVYTLCYLHTHDPKKQKKEEKLLEDTQEEKNKAANVRKIHMNCISDEDCSEIILTVRLNKDIKLTIKEERK